MNLGDYKLHSFFQLSSQWMAVSEGSLQNASFVCSWRMAIHSSVFVSSPKRYFRSCTFWLELQLITVLSIGSSHWVATQLVTCRFVCIWAVSLFHSSQTCLCTYSLVTATTQSCMSALSINLTVAPSMMDFTVSASSFDVILLRASAAALSHPFWYSVLKVNPVEWFYPVVLSSIYIGCSQDVSEWVVLSFDNEWLPEQVFLKLHCNHPLQC